MLSKWHYLILLLAGIALSACSTTGELRPFTSDGCSLFPEGTRDDKELWFRCCLEHDKSYWLGGTYQQRLAADYLLHECVQGVGEPAIANIMLGGVRVGGSPYWPTQFRWGYGWPYPRGYKSLSQEERAQAEKEIDYYRHKQKEAE